MFASIVVGTDGSDTATTAVRYAIELARQLGARLQTVSAYEPVSDHRLQNEKLEVPEDLQWMVNPREDVLTMLAEEQHSDLIVVGNLGMTGAKRFLLGSVPNKVSHHAPCSVLIVRTT